MYVYYALIQTCVKMSGVYTCMHMYIHVHVHVCTCTCWCSRKSETPIWNGRLQNWWKLWQKLTMRSESVLMKFTTYHNTTKHNGHNVTKPLTEGSTCSFIKFVWHTCSSDTIECSADRALIITRTCIYMYLSSGVSRHGS